MPERRAVPGRQVCQAGIVQAVRGRRRVRPGRPLRGRPLPGARRSAPRTRSAPTTRTASTGSAATAAGKQRSTPAAASSRSTSRSTTRRSRRASATGPRRGNRVHARDAGPGRVPHRSHRYVGHRGVQHRAFRAPRQSVADYLARLGIDPARLRVVPKGETEASGADEAGWSQDRRVEIEWQ